MIGDNTKHIVLLHLSEKNNTPEIALSTVKEYLDNVDFNKVTIEASKPNEISEVYEI